MGGRAAEPAADEPEPLTENEAAEAGPPRGRVRVLRAFVIAGALIAVFVVGWLGSALWFSPAPLLPAERTVPRVLELPLDDARASLERAELRARVADPRSHPTVARGVVIWQDPAPGTAVPMNTPVDLTPSAGPATVAVPDLEGFVVRDAAAVLKAAGLAVGQIDTIAAPGEGNVVLGTRPSAGTGRQRGGAVDLIVTSGDAPAERARP
jgi:serine/threonine-protein kinase